MSAMRGMDEMQEPLFTTVKLEDFVPADHPLRPVRLLVNEALKRLNGLFNVIYADSGRASIAPEKLLRALLLQVFYSVRSERMLMEQISYNMLFRWFVGLAMDDAVWDHSTFSKNRDRLLVNDRRYGAKPGSAYWSHLRIGVMEPADDRRNGATSGSP